METIKNKLKIFVTQIKKYLWPQAIDKDGSGSITVEELGQLSEKMSKKKSEALMKKLDVDGDGKITLEEFRELFVKIDKW